MLSRHAPQIQRYAVRRVGADAADDVVAETVLTAFRQRDRYRRDRPGARPWLYGIATNLIGRHRRLGDRAAAACYFRTGRTIR
jgi:DNA-directed RNA polymerase specialized sigma24 family protein